MQYGDATIALAAVPGVKYPTLPSYSIAPADAVDKLEPEVN